MVLAFLSADTVVFVILLAFLGADTLAFIMLPVVFAMIRRS